MLQVMHLHEYTFKCCISETEYENSEDASLCDALADFVDSNIKIDFTLMKYI